MDWEAILFSWGAVYVAMFLPAILMLANFVFGNCFIGEALGRAQHTTTSLHTQYRLVGRACVALTTASFGWQYYAYMFCGRLQDGSRRSAAACNPVQLMWDVVDALPNSLGSLGLRTYVLDCTWDEVVYQSLLSGFVCTYFACVLSVPQVEGKGSGGAGTELIVFCRRCGANVASMDHHCYLICNCVSTRTRPLFLTCLAFGVANLSFLLWRCGMWALLVAGPAEHIGLVMTVVFDLFLALLLTFHVVLMVRGLTTRQFLWETRGKGLLRGLYGVMTGKTMEEMRCSPKSLVT